MSLVLATPAMAEPLSYDLARCSAFSHVLSVWNEGLTDVSEVWFSRALSNARENNIPRPFETLTNIANTAEAELLSSEPIWQFTGAYREWVAGCEALSQAEGIDFRLP